MIEVIIEILIIVVLALLATVLFVVLLPFFVWVFITFLAVCFGGLAFLVSFFNFKK